MDFTEKEVDALLESVSRELENVESLSKSVQKEEPKASPAALKKDEEEDEKPAPAAEAPAEAAPRAYAEAPAEAAPRAYAEASPEGEGEAPGAQPDISDEDLAEIYASMPPEELERHIMIAQAVLSHMKGEDEEGAAYSAPPEQPMAMSEKADREGLAKAESRIDEIAKQVETIGKSVDLLTKAIEAGFKPIRKSVAGIEFTERAPEGPEQKPLTKSELVAKLNDKAKSPNLSKADREVINRYCMYGEGRDQAEKLVSGGK
jgi:hypothetical protein